MRAVDGVAVAVAAHGYSHAEYYLAAPAFSERRKAGLAGERRGRKGLVKLNDENVSPWSWSPDPAFLIIVSPNSHGYFHFAPATQ